jgi:hypothetical protein
MTKNQEIPEGLKEQASSSCWTSRNSFLASWCKSTWGGFHEKERFVLGAGVGGVVNVGRQQPDRMGRRENCSIANTVLRLRRQRCEDKVYPLRNAWCECSRGESHHPDDYGYVR